MAGCSRPRIARADYGTNHAAAWSHPDEIPPRSNDILITSTVFNDSGDAEFVTNPAGITRFQDFDNAGRLIKTVEDYSTTPGPLNIESTFAYNGDGNLLSSTRKNNSTGDQTTNYTYGTTLADSDIASNLLLRAVAYPDSTGSSDRVEFKYNSQGEVKEKKDQAGTIHTSTPTSTISSAGKPTTTPQPWAPVSITPFAASALPVTFAA